MYEAELVGQHVYIEVCAVTVGAEYEVGKALQYAVLFQRLYCKRPKVGFTLLGRASRNAHQQLECLNFVIY